MTHIPVLIKEVLQYLDPKPNENFIDCTVGEAGHAMAILEKNGPEGKVLGIDLDPQQIENCKEPYGESACWRQMKIENYKNRMILVNDSYANLQEIVEKINFKPVNGILLDLGMSSEQLENGRGFTFLKDEPLDMRYAHEIQNDLTAEYILNNYSQKEIEKFLREYGEEKFSRRIAREIIEQREIKPIKSTFQLVEVIKRAVPKRFQHGRVHCATKTFQALRIAVNSELENLKKVLPPAVSVLSPGGRLVIISFHSLEDRIVKNFFREKSKEGAVKLLLKKPAITSSEEIKLNPRSRSAKLRAVIKL